MAIDIVETSMPAIDLRRQLHFPAIDWVRAEIFSLVIGLLGQTSDLSAVMLPETLIHHNS